MMKKYALSLGILAFCLLGYACDNDDDTVSVPLPEKTDFEIACEKTGGILAGDTKCSCLNVICDDGLVCNSLNKACPAVSISETCDNGQTHCVNSKYYECKNYQWALSKDADIKNRCDKYGCLPDNSNCAECTKNSCIDGNFITCNNGKITKTEACKSNTCENDSKCKDFCNENEITCKDGQLFICTNNDLVKKKDCPAGCDLETHNSCASTCSEGDKVCENGSIKTCNGGVFGSAVSCENNASCKDDNNCGVCHNGDTRCVEDADKIGTLQVCENGQWSEGTVCKNGANSVSCNGNQCGDCLSGSDLCVHETNAGFNDVGFIYQCIDGIRSEKGNMCIDNFGNRSSCGANNQCGECLNGINFCKNYESSTNMYTCVNGKRGEFVEICTYGCSETKQCQEKEK